MQQSAKDEINSLLRTDLKQLPLTVNVLMPMLEKQQYAMWELNNDNERLLTINDLLNKTNDTLRETIKELKESVALGQELLKLQSALHVKPVKPTKTPWWKRVINFYT
jgi:hypothetical protein